MQHQFSNMIYELAYSTISNSYSKEALLESYKYIYINSTSYKCNIKKKYIINYKSLYNKFSDIS